ncbi:MAG: c-type cytochrome [Pseudomonadota bacterium]
MRDLALIYTAPLLTLLLAACAESGGSNEAATNESLVTKAKLLDLANRNGCFECHAIDRTVVGPSWSDIAKKYPNSSQQRASLIANIKNGSKGTWGNKVMPPNSPKVADADIEQLVDYILSLDND